MKVSKIIISFTLVISLTVWFSISKLPTSSSVTDFDTNFQQKNVIYNRPMEELELQLLLGSGFNGSQCDAWQWICVVSNTGSMIPSLFTQLIFGPTSAMCLLDLAFDFTSC